VRFPIAVLAVFAFHISAPFRQAGEALRIDSPAAGQEVVGTVDITGAAALPQMIRWRLSFAYDPDPTDTWFAIAEGTQPVEGGILAHWDTGGISEGTYALRVQAFFADGSTRESVVGGIRVRRSPGSIAAASPEPSAPAAAVSEPMRSAPVFPAPTLAFGETPAAPAGGSARLPALLAGAGTAAGMFALYGIRLRLSDWKRRRILHRLRRSANRHG
jgi:hypothetical protein